MKTKTKLKTYALGGLILVVFLSLSSISSAQGRRGDRRGFPRQHFLLMELTEEQREEIKTLIQSMRDQDADRKDIHEAVQAKMKEWGIEKPERPLRLGRFGGQLTEEQREEIKNLIQSMRDQDADRKDIHEAVQAKMKEWGIEKPERPLRLGRFGGQLTEEQREEIKNLIQSMRDQDADRKDIHEDVQEKLKEWGIEPPKGGDRGHGFGRVGRGGRGGFWGKLSDDQKNILKEKITELRDQDATREEIRTAVRELLKEWGIESPRRGQGWQNRGKNQKRGHSSIRANNRPNPFNPETIINYTLENPEHVTIKIYNIQGQLIRTLTDTQKSTGTHSVRWNGRHENGEMASAGMYVYRIEAGKQILTGRMTLAK